MSYHVETTARFDKEFKKLDKYTQQIIKSWIGKNLQNCENPRAHGKGLTANKSGQWRYRIGDYRLLCLIQDQELIILALTVGHRRDIYSTQGNIYFDFLKLLKLAFSASFFVNPSFIRASIKSSLEITPSSMYSFATIFACSTQFT